MKYTISVLLFAGGILGGKVPCDTTKVSPAPDGLVCEVAGRALVTKYGVRQFHATSQDQCRDLCMADPNCQSFSYLTSSGRCRILGTQTKTEQIKPSDKSPLVFSNKACYVRKNGCYLTNSNLHGYYDQMSLGNSRPTEGAFGQQQAMLRPWAVYQGPQNTKSTAKYAYDSAAYSEMTIFGSEAIGLFQKTAVNTSDYVGAVPYCKYDHKIISYDGQSGNGIDNAYTFTIYYRGQPILTNKVKPGENDDWQAVGFGSEFLNGVNNSPDPSGDNTLAVVVKGPADGIANSAVIGLREIYAEPGS